MNIQDLSIGDKVHVKEYGEREYDGVVVGFRRVKRIVKVLNEKTGFEWWQDASEITHKI